MSGNWFTISTPLGMWDKSSECPVELKLNCIHRVYWEQDRSDDQNVWQSAQRTCIYIHVHRIVYFKQAWVKYIEYLYLVVFKYLPGWYDVFDPTLISRLANQ